MEKARGQHVAVCCWIPLCFPLVPLEVDSWFQLSEEAFRRLQNLDQNLESRYALP